jgi:hypothetical protein
MQLQCRYACGIQFWGIVTSEGYYSGAYKEEKLLYEKGI